LDEFFDADAVKRLGMKKVEFVKDAGKTSSWLDSRVKQLKEASLKRWGPYSGATAQQQELILQHAAEESIQIGIRAADRITAGGTKLGTWLGLEAKSVYEKAKSIFGILPGKGLRSDLDIAFVRDLKSGEFLNEQEILERVVDPLNRKFITAGDSGASFMHGGAFTGSEARGGFLNDRAYGRVNSPGPVTIFGEGKVTHLLEQDVYKMAMANPEALPWHPGWNVPKGIAPGNQGESVIGLVKAETQMAAVTVPGGFTPSAIDIGALRAESEGTGRLGSYRGSGWDVFPTSVDEKIALRVRKLGTAPLNATDFAEEARGLQAYDQLGFMGYSGSFDIPSAGDTERRLQGFAIEKLPGLDDRDVHLVRETLTASQRRYVDAAEELMQRVKGQEFDFQYGKVGSGPRKGHVAIYDPPSLTEEQLQNAQPLIQQFRKDFPNGGAPIRTDLSGMTSTDDGNDLLSTQAPLALSLVAEQLWSSESDPTVGLNIRVALADLPTGELAESFITRLNANGVPSEGKIVIDRDADGRGWFIDPTPLDDSEFAEPNSAAFGHYDLFSVIAHEVGHTLGFLRGFNGYDLNVTEAADGSFIFVGDGFSAMLSDDGSHLNGTVYATDLMSDTLSTFQRKLPSVIDSRIVSTARETAATASQIPAKPAVDVSPLPDTSAPDLSGTDDLPIAGPAELHSDTTPAHIVNGNFDIAAPDSDGFGWTTLGGGAVLDGRGVLSEHPRLVSRLTQTVLVPAGATALMFTIIDADFDAPGSGPSDAFEVAVLDADTMAP
ncbi:MAG TPA: hypothetical protein VK210_11190, partial [Terriglobia bacterium]|nr:hypothetical protein [Terriglobia bacterium]